MSSTEPWVVEVTRGELVESEHRVALVVLEPDGTTALRAGAVDVPMLPRSALKPAQAVAVLEALAGTTADLDDRELALAAGSHSGEPEHLALAAGLLARHGLDADALGCPPARPLGVAADHAWGERAPERLAMNCSGKHAAMLAACVARGLAARGPPRPRAPAAARGAGRPSSASRAPSTPSPSTAAGRRRSPPTSLAVARLGLALDAAPADTPEGRVAAAMRAHPGLVAGPDRLDTVLMTVLPGALSKVGAEGVLLAVLPDGASLALAVVDGAGRAVGPVLLEVLRRRGLDHLDRTAELTSLAAPLVRGGGHPIGVHRVRS